MLKEYELWLDESGSFDNEKANATDTERFEGGFHPSLIGGWLVPYDTCHHNDLAGYVITNPQGEEHHAAGMSDKSIEFAGMNAVHDNYRGRIVLFQNKELLDPGNRELYLRLMASGLLQLLQELNAGTESLKLHVIIARRMDMTKGTPAEQEIVDHEYLEMLETYIHSKKRAGRIMLHEDTEMSITIDSARKDNRLKMADYVCHTELTLNSGIFIRSEINVFENLKKNAYIYSFSENTTENNINMALSQGNVADALVEAVFNSGRRSFTKMLKTICKKISVMGYRGAKVQLDQCTKEFTTYVYMEDDFERSEEFLKTLLTIVIPEFEKRGFPSERFKFSMELLLIDMYLREGDIEKASGEMIKCREAEKQLSSSLESLLYHYQLIEKESLLAIDSFEFEKGSELMEKACEGFRAVMDCIPHVDALKERFPDIISEYYGDALCMKIYAELFLQRSKPELGNILVEESDIALKQYVPHEGELERHRQYRSVIEMQRGNYDAAAKWLLMTQKGRITMASLEDGTVLTKKDFSTFLRNVIEGEGKSARRYYLMYYVKIMAEAALAGSEVAIEMAQALALKSNQAIHEPEDMHDKTVAHNDHGTSTHERVVRTLDSVIRPAKYIDYHPLEVNYWKQATYRLTQKKYREAEGLYKKALKVCYTYSNYIQLAIIGLGIWAEYIVCLIDKGDTDRSHAEYNKLLKKTESLLKNTRISGNIGIINKIRSSLMEARKDGELDRNIIWETSRLITF
ncbi:MAG: hypothetical protein K6E85_16950 [Lachnospiraceae bacterium]|nr:hypothetical protein [Lachnospiraceae bacterium]